MILKLQVFYLIIFIIKWFVEVFVGMEYIVLDNLGLRMVLLVQLSMGKCWFFKGYLGQYRE